MCVCVPTKVVFGWIMAAAIWDAPRTHSTNKDKVWSPRLD